MLVSAQSVLYTNMLKLLQGILSWAFDDRNPKSHHRAPSSSFLAMVSSWSLCSPNHAGHVIGSGPEQSAGVVPSSSRGREWST